MSPDLVKPDPEEKPQRPKDPSQLALAVVQEATGTEPTHNKCHATPDGKVVFVCSACGHETATKPLVIDVPKGKPGITQEERVCGECGEERLVQFIPPRHSGQWIVRDVTPDST